MARSSRSDGGGASEGHEGLSWAHRGGDWHAQPLVQGGGPGREHDAEVPIPLVEATHVSEESSQKSNTSRPARYWATREDQAKVRPKAAINLWQHRPDYDFRGGSMTIHEIEIRGPAVRSERADATRRGVVRRLPMEDER